MRVISERPLNLRQVPNIGRLITNGFLKKEIKDRKDASWRCTWLFVERSDLVETQIGDLILDSQGGGLLSSGDSITYMFAPPSDLEMERAMTVFMYLVHVLEEEGLIVLRSSLVCAKQFDRSYDGNEIQSSRRPSSQLSQQR